MTVDDKKRYLILKDPNIIKGLIILAFPLMLNNLIKTLHDVIDMFFVSKIPGYSADAVASISVTFPIVFTFISLGMGLSIAGTALISQYVGSAQPEDAKRYSSNLLLLAFGLGVLLNVLSYTLAPVIMRVMGTEGFVLENSVRYLQIRSFELPFVFLFFAFTAIRQSSGDTITPVIYGVITMILNIVLSPILISTLNLGVAGAAYATLIANIVIMPFGIYTLFKTHSGIQLDFKTLRISLDVAKDILTTAIPASMGQALTAIGFAVMNTIIISYGTNTVAAFSVGNRIVSMILHPIMAISGILAAYIGQNIGNLNVERAKETFKKALFISFIMMVLGSLILINFRKPLASLFIEDNLFALNLTIEYMFYLLIGLPLMAIYMTFIGTYNGTGNTKYTFVIGVTRLWLLRIPAILIFKEFTTLGSSGIWYAMLISNFVIAFIGFLLYLRIDFEPKVRIRAT